MHSLDQTTIHINNNWSSFDKKWDVKTETEGKAKVEIQKSSNLWLFLSFPTLPCHFPSDSSTFTSSSSSITQREIGGKLRQNNRCWLIPLSLFRLSSRFPRNSPHSTSKEKIPEIQDLHSGGKDQRDKLQSGICADHWAFLPHPASCPLSQPPSSSFLFFTVSRVSLLGLSPGWLPRHVMPRHFGQLTRPDYFAQLTGLDSWHIDNGEIGSFGHENARQIPRYPTEPTRLRGNPSRMETGKKKVDFHGILSFLAGSTGLLLGNFHQSITHAVRKGFLTWSP